MFFDFKILNNISAFVLDFFNFLKYFKSFVVSCKSHNYSFLNLVVGETKTTFWSNQWVKIYLTHVFHPRQILALEEETLIFFDLLIKKNVNCNKMYDLKGGTNYCKKSLIWFILNLSQIAQNDNSKKIYNDFFYKHINLFDDKLVDEYLQRHNYFSDPLVLIYVMKIKEIKNIEKELKLLNKNINKPLKKKILL